MLTNDPTQTLADLRGRLDLLDATLAGEVATSKPRAEIRGERELLLPQLAAAQLAAEISEARRLHPEYGEALARFHALRGEIEALERGLAGQNVPGSPVDLATQRLALVGEMQALTSRLDALRAAAYRAPTTTDPTRRTMR